MAYLREEKKLWRKGYLRVAGTDESGRGPLAGPVIAAAVAIILAETKNQKPKIKNIIKKLELLEIKDSKKLTPKKREEFYKILIKHPQIKWGIGKVSEKVIDKINILEATKLAMIRAVKNLRPKALMTNVKSNPKPQTQKINVDFLIIDGNFNLPAEALAKAGINSKIPQESIIKADEKVFSCMAASIIAKVTRDNIMKRENKKYPKYGFDKHKGYPTKLHLVRLQKYGLCSIHRKSFKPVKHLNI